MFFEVEVKEILHWSLDKKKHYSRLFFSTGYGKSLIYQMLPSLFDKITTRNLSSKNKSIVLVVSPLNALIDHQINKLKSAGVNCTSLRVCGDEVDGAFEEKIRVVPYTESWRPSSWKVWVNFYTPRGNSEQQAM